MSIRGLLFLHFIYTTVTLSRQGLLAHILDSRAYDMSFCSLSTEDQHSFESRLYADQTTQTKGAMVSDLFMIREAV